MFKLRHIVVAMFANSVAISTAIAQDTPDVERIIIEGRFLSVNESNSVKTPTPILDVPQSLSIITAQQLTSRGIDSIGHMVDYIPGVNTSQGEGHRDALVFRGIRSTADFYLDGNRDDVQYYRALYNVEQVEVLRGPNALLFGRGGTGGILNRVSKKAVLDNQFTDYQASLNSFGGYDVQLDHNFISSPDSAVRVNAMYEELENHRDFYDGTRIGINPTARVALGDKTVVDFSYEYIDHERFIDRGIPTGNNGRPVERLKNIVFVDPQNSYHELEAHVLRANLEHRFSDNLKGSVNAFYGDYDKIYANFYPTDFNTQTNIVELDGYIDGTVRDNFILSGNLVGEYRTGDIGHTLIFGVEVINTQSDQYRFNPVFSTSMSDRERFIASRPLQFNDMAGVNASGDAFTVDFSDFNDETHVDLDVVSVYLQDEIELLPQLDVVVGARFDSFDIGVFNADPLVLETKTRKDEEISPRAGLVYKPIENISLYASYSESFLPRSGEQYTDINGSNDQLEPDTYSNQEVGVKWDINTDLSLTAAVFENQQRSPQVADNDPATLDVINSEISGFEFQFSGYLNQDWYFSANYSYLEGEIVDRRGPTGRTPRELPENMFSLWSSYQLTDKFGLGMGITYQDESFIDNGNNAVLPSYTRVDLAAYYDVSTDLRLQLNIENLTDELYLPNAHSTHQATVAEPLNATLTFIGSF